MTQYLSHFILPVVTVPPISQQEPPPPPENFNYRILPDGTVELSWTIPDPSEVENVGVGFGSYGIPAQFLTVTELAKTAVTYIADQVTAGSRYIAMVVTRNRFGQSEPVTITVQVPNDNGMS